MSQTNTGQNGSSPQERLASREADLDALEARLGLPEAPQPDGEVERLLRTSPAQLRAMSAIECGEAAVLLASFALHLQRAANREQSSLGLCEEGVRSLVAPLLDKAGGWSYEERKSKAVRLSEYAKQLDGERIHRRARAERLAYLAARVDFLAKTLLELQQTKRKYHG